MSQKVVYEEPTKKAPTEVDALSIYCCQLSTGARIAASATAVASATTAASTAPRA